MRIFLIILSTLIINSTFAQEVINDLNPFESTRENRLGFMLGVHPSLRSSMDTTNFALSYARKFENFWIDSNVLITNGLFRRLSANNAGATGAADFQLSEQKNSVTTFGLGIGRETQYAQTLIPLDDLYELTAANLTYNVYNEGLSNKTFTGPGLLAKFSLYKMFSEFYAAGVHFNYNLAVVKRTQDTNTETSSRRSLTLGYLTVGFDLSLFL